ncbi:AbrB/MazE/SpoVT family DNA-binding domain-containing protein [Nitrospira sp. M1]
MAVFQNYRYTEFMQAKITINERGALTVPAKMRAAFGIKAHDELIIEDTEQGLLLRPAFSVPVEIYTEERINEFASDEKAIGKLLSPEK